MAMESELGAIVALVGTLLGRPSLICFNADLLPVPKHSERAASTRRSTVRRSTLPAWTTAWAARCPVPRERADPAQAPHWRVRQSWDCCLAFGVGIGICLAVVLAVVISYVHHDIAPTPPNSAPFGRSAPVRQADRANGAWMNAQFRTLQRLALGCGQLTDRYSTFAPS